MTTRGYLAPHKFSDKSRQLYNVTVKTGLMEEVTTLQLITVLLLLMHIYPLEIRKNQDR